MILYCNGLEALEALQTAFPLDWKQEIAAGQSVLRILRNFYNCSTDEAISKYIDNARDDSKRILIMASGHLMMQEDALECLTQHVEHVSAQLKQLETTKYSPRDIIVLAEFYNMRMMKYIRRMEKVSKVVPIKQVPLSQCKSKILT